MAEPIAIRSIAGLAPQAAEHLAAASEAERLTFVRRLVDELASGANRFAMPGELLLGAFDGPALVGVCGLNRDPYGGDPRVGRLRHLYVLPAYRRHGIGRLLVAAVVAEARRSFDTLTLRTHSADAAAFYRALGFHEAAGVPAATHSLSLRAQP